MLDSSSIKKILDFKTFSHYDDCVFTSEDLYSYQEIYSKVLIYNNVFKDIKAIQEVLKNSSLNPDASFLLKDWSQWGGVDSPLIFGEYIQGVAKGFSIKDVDTPEKEALVIKELHVIEDVVQAFFKVTDHFMKKFNITKSKAWKQTPPSFCRYIPGNYENEDLFMYFHTDYQIADANNPGYKFVITTTMYVNDDYRDGEILFKMGDDLITYKPKAGDILVFPSGHPIILTENEYPIMHAVKSVPIGDPDRYMIRMFHQIYSDGDIISRFKNN